MDQSTHFEAAPERAMLMTGALRGRMTRMQPASSTKGDREELAASEPIDIYHWAAVALVTALMCAVLGYAAGTQALSRAANVTSLVFGSVGGALTASGIVRSLRARIAASGVREPLGAAVAESR
jgi:hypothetical protein